MTTIDSSLFSVDGPTRRVAQSAVPSDGVRIADVEILSVDATGLLHCRRREQRFYVPSYMVLPGSEARAAGQRGVLVLPPAFARSLGLTEE
jgi:hypothetical protein